MTPPVVSKLKLDAAIAHEDAKLADAMATKAELEHERSVLAANAAVSATVNGFTYFLAAIVVSFVAYSFVTEPAPATTASPTDEAATAAARAE